MGQSVKMLNYSNDDWNRLMQSLQVLAEEEGVKLCEQTVICNSRKALLLSEASKSLGAEVFYPLHEQLFSDYFIKGKNIGDEAVLRDIARQHKIPEQFIDETLNVPHANGPADSVPAALLPYLQYAGAIKATSVPCFIIGDTLLSGVVTREKLLQTASLSDNKESS